MTAYSIPLAVVVKCPDPRHATIVYEYGESADVLTRNIILTGGAVARPQLYVSKNWKIYIDQFMFTLFISANNG